MSFERIAALAKEQFRTMPPRYAGHRIHMSAALSARLMQEYQPPERERDISRLRDVVFGAPLLYQLMGIPIVIDVGMTNERQWILVDPTGEEVERGEVDAATPTETREREASGTASE
jgi:hypothetical protein